MFLSFARLFFSCRVVSIRFVELSCCAVVVTRTWTSRRVASSSLRFQSAACAVVAALHSATPAFGQVDPGLLAGMTARSIGPAGMSGRVADVVAAPSDPTIVYVGAATGGVWKSVNGGLNFEPVFDDQPVAAIGPS